MDLVQQLYDYVSIFERVGHDVVDLTSLKEQTESSDDWLVVGWILRIVEWDLVESLENWSLVGDRETTECPDHHGFWSFGLTRAARRPQHGWTILWNKDYFYILQFSCLGLVLGLWLAGGGGPTIGSSLWALGEATRSGGGVLGDLGDETTGAYTTTVDATGAGAETGTGIGGGTMAAGGLSSIAGIGDKGASWFCLGSTSFLRFSADNGGGGGGMTTWGLGGIEGGAGIVDGGRGMVDGAWTGITFENLNKSSGGLGGARLRLFVGAKTLLPVSNGGPPTTPIVPGLNPVLLLK